MGGILLVASALWALSAPSAQLAFSDPARLAPPPADAAGFPSSNAGLDAREGFSTPPPGYGEVPFWWWTGDPLDKERLLWQLDKLHAAGIPGVQINYAHDPGMLTYPVEPPIFSEPWWDIWRWMTEECRKRGMGIGLSGYTIDWPGHDNLFYQIGVTDGSVRGASLIHKSMRVKGRKDFSWKLPDGCIGVTAYKLKDDAIVPGSGVSLQSQVRDGQLEWTPPAGQWQVIAVIKESPERSVDPMDPASGQKVIERFLQPFADHCPGESGKALNYFFHDELNFGVHGWLWTERFAAEFERRKGYDIVPVLPALFCDIGPSTPKIRLDYSDVMVSLTEECFFRPIFEWHWKRGITYACDPGSRGGDPLEFGDYFRCIRWYAAPGHDTPGGKADLHKDKVSSSIAHLYQRPRVWLEGYHSLGWGATPATIFDSSCKNFLYGANLLNLHGLYYTTHGGYWEWAPPCFHFRMPYWEHMGSFFRYFERLSYLLSQGVHRCDVAILYPTAPLEAGLGNKAVETAFTTGDDLYMQHGIDFDFMDFESLDRAQIQERQLCVSGEAYRVLILPSMRALRQSTLDKALAFYRAGGVVLATGALPEASDRIGREDAELDAAVRELFGVTAAQARDGKTAPPQTSDGGGVGAAVKAHDALAALITRSIPRDFVPEGAAQVLHRKIGPREVYLVMGAAKNSESFFRATGTAELWDPWTGGSRPLHGLSPAEGGTRLRMPLDAAEAQLIVFEPGECGISVEKTDLEDLIDAGVKEGKVIVTGYARSAGEKTAVIHQGSQMLTLRGEAPAPAAPVAVDGLWDVELKPTLDNRWGDFRLPASDAMIGAEARQFLYAEETAANPGWEAANVDDAPWKKVTHSFGTRFWKLGPLAGGDSAVEEQLARLTAVDPSRPVAMDGKESSWQAYEFSMRWGVEGDPGPQGYHGLKELISDDFIVLGQPKRADTAITYEKEPQGTRYYLWTSAWAPRAMEATILAGNIKPSAVWVNGAKIEDFSATVSLKAGANPVLLRYDAAGRTHFVLKAAGAAAEAPAVPLAMRWNSEPGIVPFDAKPREEHPAGWYRFVSPPGLQQMTIVARGAVQAWADGTPMTVSAGKQRSDGATEYTAAAAQVNPLAAKVALRIMQERGCYGGAALPEPIALTCGPGRMPAGDWAQMGALADYSGGLWYRKTIALTPEQTRGRVLLDLGRVCATAEIFVNGQSAGVKLTPPWTLDISSLVKPGDNRMEILVCNTLANHYGTIPTRYRGSPESGLIGPVSIQTSSLITLTSGDAASSKSGAQQPTGNAERIVLGIDKRVLHPVRNEHERAKLSLTALYSDGSQRALSASEAVITAKTRQASGGVEVVAIEGDELVPREGGIATVEAAFEDGGRRLTASADVVVAPFYRDYHQTLVLKLFLGMEGEPVPRLAKEPLFQREHDVMCTFEEALETIRKTDNLTRGMAKIVYLVGWQKGGHDHGYPAWGDVNPRLKRREDATALDSLRWLIREARKFNTTVSLHINMTDAYKQSPLWDEYVARDCLAKDENGRLLVAGIQMEGEDMYNVVYPQEWSAGLAQRRIDALIEMIPELLEGHTIHIDVFIAQREGGKPISPWHALPGHGGLTPERYVETQRKIFHYWRERGFDVTGEGIFWAHPAGEGFTGLQAMSWWYPDDRSYQMQIPECLMARGRTDRGGDGDFRFGSSMHGEEIYTRDRDNLPGFLGMFCRTTLPWYYLSRLDREKFEHDALYYSDGVVARLEKGKRIIRDDEFLLREDDNLFVPALWNEREIIAYSKPGYRNKSWRLPISWSGVSRVDTYRITLDGCVLQNAGVPVADSRLVLSLDEDEAVSIVPSGSRPAGMN